MNAVEMSLELSRDRLREQSDSLRQLTTKASIMLGIAAIVATGEVPKDVQGTALTTCMYLSAFICGGCGLFAIFPRTYWGPSLRSVAEIFRDYDYDAAREWVVEAYIAACEHNARQLDRIGYSLFAGLTFLALSISIRVFLQVIHSL